MPVLVLDFETNGLNSSHSILQVGLILIQNGKVSRLVNRYYLPKEELNLDAYYVHGLDEKTILSKRTKQKANYPIYFDDDTELLEFLKFHLEQRKDLLVVYNADFEVAFLQERNIYPERVFDVMKAYTSICQIEHPYYGWKFPKLFEAVRCLGITPRELHNALIDAYYTYKLFKFYPYFKEKRDRHFETSLQLEMINEYPVNLLVPQRFRLWFERKNRQRKFLRKFFQVLDKSKTITLVEFGKGRREEKNKSKIAELFLRYLHLDLVENDGNTFMLGSKIRIIFPNLDN
jgi:DNA polymerase III epsilon subunit-like protein